MHTEGYYYRVKSLQQHRIYFRNILYIFDIYLFYLLVELHPMTQEEAKRAPFNLTLWRAITAAISYHEPTQRPSQNNGI